MSTGRIRRNARRGLAVAVLGWLAVAAFAVFMAPSASAAPTATVEIRNFTPPAASVDRGGQVTFVNRIPAQNKGGITVGIVGGLSATVHTDVSVTFFGQKKALQNGQSAAWTFNDPATNGTITYTYRIVPQAGLAADVANQVVSIVSSQLPPLPAPIPYVVQTIAPDVPQLPSVNLPQLPQVEVQVPAPLPAPAPNAPVPPTTVNPTGQPPAGQPPAAGTPTPAGPAYQYDTSTGPRLAPADMAAAAAFDPARFAAVTGGSSSGSSGSGGPTSGSGGAPGGYDGASVPVFGQLAGLDGTSLQEESAERVAAGERGSAQTLPAAALAAVVALAAVIAALVRTHQASRSSR
ncbi:hypothetical protein [Blastococcus sp. PRF04-17]|uniref:hypothetical protein n=1 Tax=Blastococcus sp. PRF04-17 TaxID=2933797 RepID=UPI001FF22FAF|nr:hypothetical protein [Blastococcus sp. PRF04-17]UOY00588.1 hypothetical protein MVA48_16520 [Blastococcus sp. PRF04-17]